ncbi:MAG: hypothetical protein WAP03_13630 [Methylorubrum rhodinum]|uniref:hypothetical protein n=1 Tax=Methylorubrum rhodinum TaxID=29428 RepID=UPI003BAF7F01
MKALSEADQAKIARWTAQAEKDLARAQALIDKSEPDTAARRMAEALRSQSLATLAKLKEGG